MVKRKYLFDGLSLKEDLGKEIKANYYGIMCPIREKNGDLETLLIRRGFKGLEGKPMSYAGEWVFPGGKYDHNLDKNSILKTAIREFKEETGYIGEINDTIHFFNFEERKVGSYNEYSFFILPLNTSFEENFGVFEPDLFNGEIIDMKWMKLQEAVKHISSKRFLEGQLEEFRKYGISSREFPHRTVSVLNKMILNERNYLSEFYNVEKPSCDSFRNGIKDSVRISEFLRYCDDDKKIKDFLENQDEDVEKLSNRIFNVSYMLRNRKLGKFFYNMGISLEDNYAQTFIGPYKLFRFLGDENKLAQAREEIAYDYAWNYSFPYPRRSDFHGIGGIHRFSAPKFILESFFKKVDDKELYFLIGEKFGEYIKLKKDYSKKLDTVVEMNNFYLLSKKDEGVRRVKNSYRLALLLIDSSLSRAPFARNDWDDEFIKTPGGSYYREVPSSLIDVLETYKELGFKENIKRDVFPIFDKYLPREQAKVYKDRYF